MFHSGRTCMVRIHLVVTKLPHRSVSLCIGIRCSRNSNAIVGGIIHVVETLQEGEAIDKVKSRATIVSQVSGNEVYRVGISTEDTI